MLEDEFGYDLNDDEGSGDPTADETTKSTQDNLNDAKEVKDFWQEYPSIDSAKSLPKSKVCADDAARDDWVALEKVHGSNFCWIVGEKKGDRDVVEIVGARFGLFCAETML